MMIWCCGSVVKAFWHSVTNGFPLINLKRRSSFSKVEALCGFLEQLELTHHHSYGPWIYLLRWRLYCTHCFQIFEFPASKHTTQSDWFVNGWHSGCHGLKLALLEKLRMEKSNSKTEWKNTRGLYAQFLRQNPRYINQPICNISRLEDGGANVGECLRWNNNKYSMANRYIYTYYIIT